MRRFALKSIVFIALPLVLLIAIDWAAFKINMPRDIDACYLWGDSQMYRGIDLTYLNANNPRKFYSSAQHGAGVYDFLVFTETVPNNSRVIISISHTVLIRRKDYDKNVSAINFNSLLKLFNNNYSAVEISKILYKNIKPHKLFYKTSKLYSDAGFSPNPREPISLFKDIYSKKPAYYDDKKKLYLEGIKTLIDKKCKIVAIAFPFHPMLQNIEEKSPLIDELNRFDNNILEYIPKRETIEISSRQNIFKDYTHLNERGAKLLSKGLGRFLDYNEHIFIIVKYIN